jgi:hypothetical protein
MGGRLECLAKTEKAGFLASFDLFIALRAA